MKLLDVVFKLIDHDRKDKMVICVKVMNMRKMEWKAKHELSNDRSPYDEGFFTAGLLGSDNDPVSALTQILKYKYTLLSNIHKFVHNKLGVDFTEYNLMKVDSSEKQEIMNKNFLSSSSPEFMVKYRCKEICFKYARGSIDPRNMNDFNVRFIYFNFDISDQPLNGELPNDYVMPGIWYGGRPASSGEFSFGQGREGRTGEFSFGQGRTGEFSFGQGREGRIGELQYQLPPTFQGTTPATFGGRGQSGRQGRRGGAEGEQVLVFKKDLEELQEKLCKYKTKYTSQKGSSIFG